ncbi:MAG: hypothetical protein QM736_10165 [Vicinamibacterales bacterium]
MSQLATQRFACRVELAALAANAARPRILAERVDHRPAHATLGEGLELDASRFIEAVGGIDETKDPVLDEVADVNRVRHRRRHAAGQRFNKWQAGHDSAVLSGGSGLNGHLLVS